jgi:hypothetical protein
VQEYAVEAVAAVTVSCGIVAPVPTAVPKSADARCRWPAIMLPGALLDRIRREVDVLGAVEETAVQLLAQRHALG